MFRSSTQSKVFQNIVNQVEEAIIEGKLKDGDKLPSQRELKRIFKIGRGTLREALRVLEQKGLLEIRIGAGGGSIVKNSMINQASDSLAWLIRSQKVTLEHLYELRLLIEGDVANLAAQRAQKPDIDQLKIVLNDLKIQVDKGTSHFHKFLEEDKKFHLYLSHITGNPIYIFILKTIHDNIHRFYEDLLPKREDVLLENFKDHCEISIAIENKRNKEAMKHAENHVRRNYRFMTKKEL